VSRRALVLAALLLIAGPLAAQDFSQELAGAIRGYKLDEGKATAVVKTLEELTSYLAQHPEAMKLVASDMKLPADERIKLMDQRPQSASILKANGLTGRDYFVGLVALRAAAQAASGNTQGLGALASPGNVQFLKANPALAARLRKAEGAR
jgi:hypothetical protein